MVIEGNTWHLVTVCGESENPLQYMLEDTSFVNLLFPLKWFLLNVVIVLCSLLALLSRDLLEEFLPYVPFIPGPYCSLVANFVVSCQELIVHARPM